jgi:hypothetical protein
MSCAIAAMAAASAAVAATTPADGYLSYTGEAVARHGDRFLYGERHVLRYQGGRVTERAVLYTCRNGTPFARKLISYVDATAPDFLLEDRRSGVREGIRSTAAGRQVFSRDSAAAAERDGPLPGVPALVADAGFDEFVQRNWTRLVGDEAVQMRFLVPTRLTDYAFQVQRLRHEEFHGMPTEVFRLRLSGFWGWFLPGIDVRYDSAQRTLLHYDGVSNLRDAAGDNFKVDIDFAPATRHPASEGDLRLARETPLVDCG